jgi:hypothetical protein
MCRVPAWAANAAGLRHLAGAGSNRSAAGSSAFQVRGSVRRGFADSGLRIRALNCAEPDCSNERTSAGSPLFASSPASPWAFRRSRAGSSRKSSAISIEITEPGCLPAESRYRCREAAYAGCRQTNPTGCRLKSDPTATSAACGARREWPDISGIWAVLTARWHRLGDMLVNSERQTERGSARRQQSEICLGQH